MSAAEMKVEVGRPVTQRSPVTVEGACVVPWAYSPWVLRGTGWQQGWKRTPVWATADAIPSRCSKPNAAKVAAGAACRLRALPPPHAEPPLPRPGSWGIPTGC